MRPQAHTALALAVCVSACSKSPWSELDPAAGPPALMAVSPSSEVSWVLQDSNTGSADPALAETGMSRFWTFYGPCSAPVYGESLSCAGDVNGDGHADLIVGMPHLTFPPDFGRAVVFSGADNSVLHTLRGPKKNAGVGYSVSGAGDVNSDGFDDVIIGICNQRDPGAAQVFSGRDGSLLYELSSGLEVSFGWCVSDAGDVDRDGFADVIVGGYHDDIRGESSGTAWVFSGSDGATLHTFHGASEGDWFGFSVSGAGDVNRDGHSDLIVGARYDDMTGSRCGSARVFSGADGEVLHTFYGSGATEEVLQALGGDLQGMDFGLSVSDAGDVDGDGYDDLIVGAPSHHASGPGSAHVYSGRDGQTLHTFCGGPTDSLFGHSVSGAGDLNGDGRGDLMVGAQGTDDNGMGSCGSVQVFSGADGSVLWACTGDSRYQRLGASVSRMDDASGAGVVGLAARANSEGGYTSLDVEVLSPDLGEK